jgi:hypothetical protein
MTSTDAGSEVLRTGPCSALHSGLFEKGAICPLFNSWQRGLSTRTSRWHLAVTPAAKLILPAASRCRSAEFRGRRRSRAMRFDGRHEGLSEIGAQFGDRPALFRVAFCLFPKKLISFPLAFDCCRPVAAHVYDVASWSSSRGGRPWFRTDWCRCAGRWWSLARSALSLHGRRKTNGINFEVQTLEAKRL